MQNRGMIPDLTGLEKEFYGSWAVYHRGLEIGIGRVVRFNPPISVDLVSDEMHDPALADAWSLKNVELFPDYQSLIDYYTTIRKVTRGDVRDMIFSAFPKALKKEAAQSQPKRIEEISRCPCADAHAGYKRDQGSKSDLKRRIDLIEPGYSEPNE